MKKNRLLTHTLIGCIALGVVSFSLAALTLGWFAGPGGKTEDQAIDGTVGLRGYFHAGTGTELDPYEITTPTHLYNLMRLQNLGVFPEKRHFRIGHVFDQNKGYQCINTITDPEDEEYEAADYVDYLNMKSLDLTMFPIGSEATPFVGEFQGNGLPIKHLSVSGYPDDIGVFGYVASDALVEGLVCEDLTINSLGYTKTTTKPDYELYHEDIDKIFDDANHKFTSGTNLFFYKKNGQSYQIPSGWANGFRGYNSGGKVITALDDPDNVQPDVRIPDPDHEGQTIVAHKFFDGYFEAQFPQISGDPFTYSWNSSSPLIKEVMKKDIAGGNSTDKVMAIDLLGISDTTKTGETDFNNGISNMQIDARISLVASYVDNDGLLYSRVIQSYKIEFNSNYSQYGAGNFTATIYCDYLNQSITGDHFTNYKHGNNIGFLAGHVDGTITNSFLYEGKLLFNDSDYNPIMTESETGLVGEIGTNVASGIEDTIGKTSHGELGSMNFSKIYSLIRDDMKPHVKVHAGFNDDTGTSYISYNRLLKDGYNELRGDTLVPVLDEDNEPVLDENNEPVMEAIETVSGHTDIKINHGSKNTYSAFSKYLRHSANSEGAQEYIVSTAQSMYVEGDDNVDQKWHEYTPTTIRNDYNAVDFLWNELIEDEKAVYDGTTLVTPAVDRGLGVFKVVTIKNNTAAAHKNDDQYSYYVTADIGKSTIKNESPISKVYFSTAEYDYTKDNTHNSSFSPLRATTLPSYCDIDTFKYPFSRDYNYVFELDLSQTASLQAKKRYHMWDTDSDFLINYLSSVLVDRFGGPITPSSVYASQFGFMFYSSDAERLDSLSSYMPIGRPGDKIGFDDDGDSDPDRYYPSNSIVFRIENENGANVSVVGRGSNDITIFKYDSTNASNDAQTGGPSALYKMKSTNTSTADSHRYFVYDAEYNPETSDELTNTTTTTKKYNTMGDNNALYAHIFHINEPGDYVIGTQGAAGTVDAQIFYLGVQGQLDASVGATENLTKVGEAISNVDFLTEIPTVGNYKTDIYFNGEEANRPNNLGRAFFEFKGSFSNSGGAFYVEIKSIQNSGNYLRLKWSETSVEDSFLLKLRLITLTSKPYYLLCNSTEESYTYTMTKR